MPQYKIEIMTMHETIIDSTNLWSAGLTAKRILEASESKGIPCYLYSVGEVEEEEEVDD